MPPSDPPSEVGLTPEEVARVRELLGRDPNALEWAMFGAMWSEHCAYKHSKKLLRTLPTKGGAVALGPGENAGAVDLGGGLLCVFKVESHNHPSAIEPYQGAATGVGGILRDVFAMGARPTAVLNALFFGPPQDLAVRRTIGGVTGGISFYGNCVGIPDVAGHISFEPCYAENPLVNAMCVGIARAIVTDATLLLCDEPTGDLDRKAGDEILDLLQALNREHGKTIIMVTHDPHASARASRTVYLNKGQLSDKPMV